MGQLAGSELLFVGSLLFLAGEASGTADFTTKPVHSSSLWKEQFAVQSFKHKPILVTSEDDIVDASGWAQEKNEFAVGDIIEVVSKRASHLFDKLDYGLASDITPGTAQSPFVNSDRKQRAWVKFQHRRHTGTDRQLADIWCEVRVMESPDVKKGVQEFKLELRVIRPWSTLNAFNTPA